MGNLTLTYFLLCLLFLTIFFTVLSVYFYSKWHIYGPRWNKFKAKFTKKEVKQEVINTNVELDTLVKTDVSAQEVLTVQQEQEKIAKQQALMSQQVQTTKKGFFGKKKKVENTTVSQKNQSLTDLVNEKDKGLNWEDTSSEVKQTDLQTTTNNEANPNVEEVKSEAINIDIIDSKENKE